MRPHTRSNGYEDGGCDARYTRTTCLWGRRPDGISDTLADALSLPPAPEEIAPPSAAPGAGAPTVLDVGCGEGRNAVRLAQRGARVLAMDVSAAALENGARAWGSTGGGADSGAGGIEWRRGDARTTRLAPGSFDGVLACSVLHWLRDERQVADVIARLQAATSPGGVNALLMFNGGHAYRPPAGEMRLPVLLPHDWYLARYDGWTLLSATDTDSTHTHTGHEEPHTHAVTRLVARREVDA
ncbi:class I SAM-dependent methyltransferase [Streptosporangium sp. NPDC002607]